MFKLYLIQSVNIYPALYFCLFTVTKKSLYFTRASPLFAFGRLCFASLHFSPTVQMFPETAAKPRLRWPGRQEFTASLTESFSPRPQRFQRRNLSIQLPAAEAHSHHLGDIQTVIDVISPLLCQREARVLNRVDLIYKLKGAGSKDRVLRRCM